MNGIDIRRALSGVAVLIFVAAVGFLAAHCLTACAQVENPRAQARAVVLEMAEGVSVADKACADIARAKKDAVLARECDKYRDAAKTSLEAAEDALDSTDAAKAGDIPCLVASAFDSATKLAELIRDAGGKLPNALQDAFDLAPMLSRGCHG